VLPGSRARIVRCGGRYDPQLVKRSSEWVSECGHGLTMWRLIQLNMSRLSLSIKDGRWQYNRHCQWQTLLASQAWKSLEWHLLTVCQSQSTCKQQSVPQTLYALRILRAHGMDDSGLQTVYRLLLLPSSHTLPVPGGVLPVLLIGKDSMHSFDEASVVA